MLRDYFVEWDEAFSVGIKAIDRQHRFLISVTRSLQEAMLDGRSRDVLASLTTKLILYTRYHFAFEEEYIAEHGGEQAAAHQAEHESLARQVMELDEKVKDGHLRSGTPVMLFLQTWLVDHILGQDVPLFEQMADGDARPNNPQMP